MQRLRRLGSETLLPMAAKRMNVLVYSGKHRNLIDLPGFSLGVENSSSIQAMAVLLKPSDIVCIAYADCYRPITP